MNDGSVLLTLKKSNGIIAKATKRLEDLKYLFPGTDLETSDTGFICEQVEIKTIYQDNNTNVAIGKQKSGCIYPIHCHKDSKEYLIVTKGRVLVKIDGVPRIMEKGECASIGVGIDHSVSSIENSELIAVCVPPEQAYNIGEEKICQRSAEKS